MNQPKIHHNVYLYTEGNGIIWEKGYWMGIGNCMNAHWLKGKILCKILRPNKENSFKVLQGIKLGRTEKYILHNIRIVFHGTFPQNIPNILKCKIKISLLVVLEMLRKIKIEHIKKALSEQSVILMHII